MNMVNISYGTRRTVFTKTLVIQLVDICGDMWRVITRSNSSHIVGELVTVGQGLKDSMHIFMSCVLFEAQTIFHPQKILL